MVNDVTDTLSYDALNHLVESSASNGGQEDYVYDASGNRVLKRSTSAGTTTLTAYPFGLQELYYTSGGTLSSQLDYYTLAGHLIGLVNSAGTIVYQLTDAEGTVLLTIGSSAVLGEQAYGPYGNQRYGVGTIGTDKGYTGQFHDSVTGFDYYIARYYDLVIGQFLSPDHVQGNAQGMDPYAYASENPETKTDPTGQKPVGCVPGSEGCIPGGVPTGSGGGGGSGNPPPPGCTWNGKPCGPNNNPCVGTVWNGSGCVAKPDPTKAKDDARKNKLTPGIFLSVGEIVIGGIILVLTDIYAIKQAISDANLPAIIAALGDMLSVLSEAASGLSLINSTIGSIAYGLVGALHGVLMLANGVLSVYNAIQAGFSWLKGVLQPVLKMIGITVQGAPDN